MQSIIIKNLDDFINIDDSKLRVIHCPDIEERRKLHNYLDTTELKHFGTLCENWIFNSAICYKCHKCNKWLMPKNKQSDKYSTNNGDYFNGTLYTYFYTCDICKNDYMYEDEIPPWYDYEYNKYISCHNMIVIGKNLKYPRKNIISTDINISEIIEILKTKDIYEFNYPNKCYSKKNYGKYIDSLTSNN